MITSKEVESTKLSATRKDWYQIWNELLETAGKISERWDPTTTNESDPGVVLLKVLTAIADKLNYNIDKNILEAYMPSAAQEASMRKLCEMMGYSMKYYRSATTDVTVYYSGDSADWQSSDISGVATLILPTFTQITNVDKDIIYTTTEQASFTKSVSSVTVPCIEGTLSYCEQDNNGIVTINNIDDNNRYYLPASQIAENGIFIYNISDSVWSSKWEQVDNLNTQELEKKVYKFGYDSKKFLPYVEFPSDISELISDGLAIAYITTNGLNGNVSAKTLTTFETPSEWTISDSETTTSYNTTGVSHEASEFNCYNASAATNGADKESLNNAYKNFKKTVGTFDTLVTCRDYMNKIYELTVSENDTTPLVSNSIVSDIRDDINRAITLCTFDECGIKYVDNSLVTSYERMVTGKDTTTGKEHTITFSEEEYAIDNFDLILYPFKTTHNLNTKAEYDSTFKNAGAETGKLIKDALVASKTISHTINMPEDDELMCIKNYLRLNAKISTATKVNAVEWTAILANIKAALYENFNNRQLDFSEEIPFDSILEVIQEADTNIKNVSLEDPDLYTSFMTADNKEYLFGTVNNPITDDEIIKKFTSTERSEYLDLTSEQQAAYIADKRKQAKIWYNKLAVRNILAGRVELFNYDTDFISTVTEITSTGYESVIYPITETGEESSNIITSLQPEFTIKDQTSMSESSRKEVTLTDDEIIQFRAPNFKTSITYPAYVNYYIALNDTTETLAVPATFTTLNSFLNRTRTVTNGTGVKTTIASEPFSIFMNKIGNQGSQLMQSITNTTDFNRYLSIYGVLFKRTPLYLYKEGAYSEINNHTMYVIPSMTVVDYTTSGITLGHFDGRIYKVNSNLRCNHAIDFTFSETGNYSKLFDSVTEAESVSAYATQININAVIGSAPSTYFNLYTTEEDMQNTKVASNIIYLYEPVTAFEEDNTYYIYPLTEDTYAVWYNWIQSYVEYQYTNYSGYAKHYNTQLSGIYRNLGGDQSRNVGKMIDANKNKYQLSTTWYSSTVSPILYYYVQQAHIGDKASTSTEWGFTQDGFGSDAVYGELTADTEYQLKPGEFLCINYTNATTSVAEMTEDSTAATTETTSEVINTYYGPGTIIKPNFALLSTEAKHATSSYSKTDGYDFSETFGSRFKNTVPGMFSLGSDEQIEIREPVSVYVYDETNTESEGFAPVYVYFNLNNSEMTFLKAMEYDDTGKISKVYSRILEEGEYFWYSDRNKTTLTYCGAGCEIFNHTNVTIAKDEDAVNVSTEDILAGGISVVPWIAVNNLFMKDPENPAASDLYIKWNEYQYINLVGTDTLKALTGDDDPTATPRDPGEVAELDYISINITKEWKNCYYATYICDDTEASLPVLKVSDACWQVRSKLAVVVNPDYSQTLKNTDYTSEKIIATQTDSSGTEIEDLEFENTSLKSNYTVNSTSDTIETTYNLYDEDGKLTETVADFKIKAFESKNIFINVSTDQPTKLTLNNMNNNYTSFNFKDYLKPTAPLAISPYTKLYSILVGGDKSTSVNYNLIMFYYQTETESTSMSDYVAIRMLPSTNMAREAVSKQYLSIFNNKDSAGNDSWWSGRTTTRARQLATVISVKDTTNAETLLFKTISTEEEFNKIKSQTVSNGGTLYLCTKYATEPASTKGYNVIYEQLDGTGDKQYYKVDTKATTFVAGVYAGISDVGYDADTLYHLKSGINIIKIFGLQSGVIEVYKGLEKGDTITFGQLSTIAVTEDDTDNDMGINLEMLDYQSPDPDDETMLTRATDLLAKINKLDPDHLFFYNADIDNSLNLDINTLAGEVLSDEALWYDYNNINNKFVISEIDSDYLDTGITLARSSSK